VIAVWTAQVAQEQRNMIKSDEVLGGDEDNLGKGSDDGMPTDANGGRQAASTQTISAVPLW
jgi:hypothetical protein